MNFSQVSIRPLGLVVYALNKGKNSLNVEYFTRTFQAKIESPCQQNLNFTNTALNHPNTNIFINCAMDTRRA